MILQKPHIWKKNPVLQLWPQILSTNQIVAFFDHQYLWKE